MKVRQFNIENDYNEIAQWWTKQGWPVLPSSILTTAGFIAEKDDQKLAVTWIFATNCPIYIMEWTVANPDINWCDRQNGIKAVTDAGCEWAKQDGAKQVFTMTKSKRFIDKLQESGFIKTDDNMTHLVRSL